MQCGDSVRHLDPVMLHVFRQRERVDSSHMLFVCSLSDTLTLTLDYLHDERGLRPTVECLAETMRSGYEAPFDWVLDHLAPGFDRQPILEVLNWNVLIEL